MDVTHLSATDIGVLETFGLLLSALALAALLPLSGPKDPLGWFGQLAAQLAAKAGHPERSKAQQYTAGTLSTLLLILPFWFILSFIPVLAAYPWFFELLILYLCINQGGLAKELLQVAQWLDTEDKNSAKTALAKRVPQSTDNLSATGLSKTAAELAFSIPAINVVGVSLAYFAGGTTFALLIRMLAELTWQWPLQSPRLTLFAVPVHRLMHLLLFIPVLIWRLLLALQAGTLTFGGVFSSRWSLFPGVITGAQVLQRQLGGPQIFNGVKVTRPRVGPSALPDASDILRAVSISRIACGYFIALLACLPLMWMIVSLYK
ncbi:cobalamin biosynthesis protein [Shewanella corallii]|uniref:Cobalamin biosynthesis protein n=1 Tax=Shewanella corallii TaxID=560080 RepID=A0ABT0N5K6_9GAMM|nr:cobalamin biosynthesis protein [Shewanella corallii]MCL2913430.1 cobalamin biosynthesis protein [Shewanella corallii]